MDAEGLSLLDRGQVSEAEARFRKALEILLDRYASDPTNGSVSDRLAGVYGALAATSAEGASAAKNTADATGRWRDARSWAQKSLDIWIDKRAKNALSAIGKQELDAMAALIVKCDRALAGHD